MHKVETRLRVRYAETDRMGIVYYANYFVWMEVGRVAYCRETGFEYRDMELEGGVMLTVTEAKCRYRAPARFDDQVRVQTWLTEARSRTVRFAYEMHRVSNDQDDQLLVTGETLHMVCDLEGKPVRLPEQYRKFFPLGLSG